MAGSADEDLRARAAEGQPYEASRATISADTIVRLARSLPFPGQAEPSPLTSAGIVIREAVISDRIALDNAVGADCCPIGLVFEGCEFRGGFSGINGHFRHLSFDGCTFVTAADELEASINLADARIDGSLWLRGVEPCDDGHPLWVDACGARVAGSLDLSGAQLCAPWGAGGSMAIDLSRAEIGGDACFITVVSRGQVNARGIEVRGDLELDGMKIEMEGEDALVLQSAVIGGMAMLCDDEDSAGSPPFFCGGGVNLRAARIGDDLHIEGATIEGYANFLDLVVDNDLLLYASIKEGVDLTGCRIGGTLDLSELRIPDADGRLLLADGTIRRALRLAMRNDGRIDPGKREPKPGQRLMSKFEVHGEIDLRGLSCDVLDDGDGELWRPMPRIQMNHFVYRRMGGRAERSRRTPSHEIVANWLRGKRAEGGAWRLLPTALLWSDKDFWEPWQVRRNWIYQQYQCARHEPDLIARHRIGTHEYHPQPFEQVIRAARAEGDEDFATHFEMLKQGIEWRFFNRLVRWWLAFVAIGLACIWLLWNHAPGPAWWVDWWPYFWTWIALLTTAILIIAATRISDFLKWWCGHDDLGPVIVTWLIFFLPALALFLCFWVDRPFHFLVAFGIFAVIRSLGVVAHFVMGRAFGYLRRPVRAIVTLIVAFSIGWLGTHVANRRNMLTVAAAPVAPQAGPDENARYPAGYDASGVPALFGSRGDRAGLVREVSCAATISEPLYALDVLIPIVDLGEERRCEIRRISEYNPHRPIVHPKSLGISEMIRAVPDLPLNDHRFWWWMKALYAIAGWVIVSLSLLTFAQVNKTHAEPPTEG